MEKCLLRSLVAHSFTSLTASFKVLCVFQIWILCQMNVWQRFSPVLLVYSSARCLLRCREHFKTQLSFVYLHAWASEVLFRKSFPTPKSYRLPSVFSSSSFSISTFLLGHLIHLCLIFSSSVCENLVVPAPFAEGSVPHCTFSPLCQMPGGCTYMYPWLGLLYYSISLQVCLCASTALLLWL